MTSRSFGRCRSVAWIFEQSFLLLVLMVVAVTASVSSVEQKKPFTPRTTIFVGPPCSGKGTQVDILSPRINVPILRSGELFRSEVKSGSELGLAMKKHMDSGKYIPDDLTRDLITRTLTSSVYKSGVVMDGYPRNLAHLEIFKDIIKSVDLEIDAIVFLDVGYDALSSRVSSRRVCANCKKSVSLSLASTSTCCSSQELFERSDDSLDTFRTRFNVYAEETSPMVDVLHSSYPEKFIHVTPDMAASSSVSEISDHLLREFENLPFRRIRKATPLAFDDPFEWLLRFVKHDRPITQEDLQFYLNWALDCNKPDQTGMLRRVVFIATTCKPKFLEYRRSFLLYGIEVIRIPVFEDQEVTKSLLSSFDSDTFSAIAVISDSSNLYKYSYESFKAEDIEGGSVDLCSLKNGVSCVNYCIMNVTYVIYDANSSTVLKSYKIMDSVVGYIKSDNLRSAASFLRVFGWDAIFYIRGLGMSYHQLRELGYKNSARDRVLSQFLRKHVHYKKARNLQFNMVPTSKSVDFSVNLTSFFGNIQEYNLDLVNDYGFGNIWRGMLHMGTFLRAAAFRRIGIYWNPGVNGGLPLIKKADRIHEITFMAHDIGHQLLPDLVYAGKNSFKHKRVYIMWRMMSEAFTMALTDMIFIDALKLSGVDYDFSKRKIYPLFKDLGLDVSPRTNPNRMETIRKIVHANFVYCLKGDDSEYREMIMSNPAMSAVEDPFANLEAFKTKYAPFFVEDFRWTEQNYNSMVSTRSEEAKKWWAATGTLRESLGPHKMRSIDEFLDMGLDGYEDDLFEQVFSVAFDQTIRPILEATPESLELRPESEPERKFRAFTRWMIGQLSICFKYDFLPQSAEVFKSISEALIGLEGRINDEQIESIRSKYEAYLENLLSLSLISADDYSTYSQVYPLFDPFFVNYDKSVTEYEHISTISSRVLSDISHHFGLYHKQAARVLGRDLSNEEKTTLNLMYEMVERSGGLIYNGLFVVEPGLMLLVEPSSPSPDATLTVLMAGVSVETSLEFIAHHETKVARLTSSKCKAMNLPLFAINNNDKTMMTLVHSALLSREGIPADIAKDYENINMTYPAAKATFATFTIRLKDLDSIFIGRLGNPHGNEIAVIQLCSKLVTMLHERYPQYVNSLDRYLNAKNQEKYEKLVYPTASASSLPGNSMIPPSAWKLFEAFKIPRPPSGAPSTSEFISIAEFNARITYLSFNSAMKGFDNSVKFVNKVVYEMGHASILSSYQVVIGEELKPTKAIYIDAGWQNGLETLLK